MTKTQERKIGMVRRQAETVMSWTELKSFEVTDCGSFVAVVAEAGSPGDEGTLAEVFCRYRVHVFIGPRGAMTIPVTKKLKSGEYKHYYKKYTSFLSAAIDQR